MSTVVGNGMSVVTLFQSGRDALLNRVHRAAPAKANLDVNEVHNAARLLRAAIARTGMNQDEAMRALGFKHKGEFSEALDGVRKLWAHQLLRKEARAIRKQLLVVSMLEEGACEVEHIVRMKEGA